MIGNSSKGRAGRRGLVVAGVFAAAMVAASSLASAGECPADKVVADGQGQKQGVTKPKGVTDTVLASIDLAHEIEGLDGRKLRTRELVIQPDGVVPSHSHADRPAIIYVLQGTVVEYSSQCAVPIVHKAGEVSREENGVTHWWKNEGKQVVKLLSSDIFHDQPGADAHMM